MLRPYGPGREHHLLVLHVLRDVDQYRPRAAVLRHGERLGHHVRQVGRVLHQIALLGDRQRDADDVGFLEGIPSDHRARHLAGDRDDWRAVHVRRGEPGDEVRGAGPRGRDAYADAAAGPGVAVRRVRRRLLVAHEDVAKAWVLG